MSEALPTGTPMPAVVELLPEVDAFVQAVKAAATPPTAPVRPPIEAPQLDSGELGRVVSWPGGSVRVLRSAGRRQ